MGRSSIVFWTTERSRSGSVSLDMNPVFYGRGLMSINQVSAMLTMHLQTLNGILAVLHSANIILHNASSLAQKGCSEIESFCS